MFSKEFVLERLWLYSRFNSCFLYQCEKVYREEKGFAAIMLLFNCLENVAKSVVDDYSSSLQNIFEKVYKQQFINQKEHDFLNTNEYSIRRVRNLYAHANIQAINLSVVENGREILYPLSENDTALYLYDKISDIVFNIILKMISGNFINEVKRELSVNVDDEISTLMLDFKTLTTEEMLVLKGFPSDYISDEIAIPESDKIRIIENAPDVNVFANILSVMLNEEDKKN